MNEMKKITIAILGTEDINATVDTLLNSDFELKHFEILLSCQNKGNVLEQLKQIESKYPDNVLLVESDETKEIDRIRTGLSYASGAYVLFVRSGQPVSESFVAGLLSIIQLVQPDIIIPKNYSLHPFKNRNGLMEISDIYGRREFLLEYGNDLDICGKLFNFQFIKNSDMLSYDIIWLDVLIAYIRAKRIYLMDYVFDIDECKLDNKADLNDSITDFYQQYRNIDLEKEVSYLIFYQTYKNTDKISKSDDIKYLFLSLFPNILKNSYIAENRDEGLRNYFRKLFVDELTCKQAGSIYILSPVNGISGGPELLHQLCAALNKSAIYSAMVYFNYNGEIVNAEVPEPYKKYAVVSETDVRVICQRENILICPEQYTILLNYIYNVHKVIFWESVDNYITSTYIKNNIIEKNDLDPLKLSEDNNCYHLVQSQYAAVFLNEVMHIDTRQIAWLSDYINDEFFERRTYKKRPQVVYNPSKGLSVLEKVIEAAPDICWVPVKNMTSKQVHELLLESMIYVDFGNHPGRDRIPREAAISGCVVITNTLGAAGYDDVPIPDKYKFDDPAGKDVGDVVSLLRFVFDNFENCSKEFDDYRRRIKSEKRHFFDDVDYVFNEVLSD